MTDQPLVLLEGVYELTSLDGCVMTHSVWFAILW